MTADIPPAEDAARGARSFKGYLRTGNIQLLETAIAHFSRDVEAVPADDPRRPGRLSNVGVALSARFDRSGRQPDLDQAIEAFREAASSAAADDSGQPVYLDNLGNALEARFSITGHLADLDQAIACYRNAIRLTAAVHPYPARLLSKAGLALYSRFNHAGERADLEQASEAFKAAVDAVSAGDPERGWYLTLLGGCLRARFDRTGERADLDRAVKVLHAAIDATPAGHPEQAKRLTNLGNVLHFRFGRFKEDADLDQAITCQREAIRATPAGHPDLERYLRIIRSLIVSRFGFFERAEDLNHAIDVLRSTVDALPHDDPERAGFLSDLGGVLRARFENSGEAEDLDRAVAFHQEAIRVTPLHYPSRSRYLSNLGIVLGDRFGHSGDAADLDQEIDVLRLSFNSVPDNPDILVCANNLAGALFSRFERYGEPADLDQAIEAFGAIVDMIPDDHPDRIDYLSNLGGTLVSRFNISSSRPDLDRGIDSLQAAIDLMPDDHPHRAGTLNNLGHGFYSRFWNFQETADLDKSIACTREAINLTPREHPSRAIYLSTSGIALFSRFSRFGERSDLDQAIEGFREGAAMRTAAPRSRLTAATRWGVYAMLAGIPESAEEAYALAIQVLPLVAWHGLDQATREQHLQEQAGLASDAAAAAIAAGHPERAAELLEGGRSVLWTQALQLRQDLAELRKRAPLLAASLEEARTVLDTPTAGLNRHHEYGDSGEALSTDQRVLAQRRRSARNWDIAIDQVRQLEGFEYFMRTVPFSVLRTTAADGPVVIVNISRHGSSALIVSARSAGSAGRGVQVIDLPNAQIGTVTAQANILLHAWQRAALPHIDWQARENDRHGVFNVLTWCWEAITEPVLKALGHTRTPGGKLEEWPRVWWCPTGPASVLPLHAAGRHPRTSTQHKAMGESTAVADTVAGRVISSYTPTLSALSQARARPVADQVRQLAIGLPDAPSYIPGSSPLPGVLDELQVLASRMSPSEDATHLIGNAATRQAVLSELPVHSWLHLSCHGYQDPDDASRSAFYLYDRRLTMADFAPLDLRNADLAYLSACQTAAGDLNLLDEARYLAAALHLIGFRHVLASMWNASDSAAPGMADIVYAELLHSDPDHPSPHDRPDVDRAPYALHHAVTLLRQSHPDEPLLWAPYIHIGP
jgi:tetratricopeptide (TPR) repeat protein